MRPTTHQFRIVPAENGQYRVQFVRDSLVLVRSAALRSKGIARTCIATIKLNAGRAETVDRSKDEAGNGFRFEIVPDGLSGYVVRFCADDSRAIVTSDHYAVKRSAEACIAALKANGPMAEIIDATAA